MMFRSFLAAIAGLFLAGSLVCAARAAEGPWPTDYPAALKEAAAEGRPILVDFTGSDWCPPCMKLSKDVFATPEFAEFAKKNLVLVEADFPMGKEQAPDLKKQNEALQEKFGVEGFPTLLILDKNGKEIGRHVGYLPGGPAAMISWIEKVLAGN